MTMFKFFIDYDHWDIFEDRMSDWWFCVWKMRGQVGFRLLGIYINLMWEDKGR